MPIDTNRSSDGPATSAVVITPSDTTVFEAESMPKALYIGVSGNLVAVLLDDETSTTFSNMIAGNVYPIRVKQVLSTGTTAAGIVGLL